jgi:division/cell wall cluster transcriptional repressor MraZ
MTDTRPEFSDLAAANVKIDGKSRIALNNAYASILREINGVKEKEETQLVLTVSGYGCLVAYPPELWKPEKKRLQKELKDNPRDRKLQHENRRILGPAAPNKVNGAGRVNLPDVLCKYAGVYDCNELTLVGYDDYFEIWNCDRYQKHLNSDIPIDFNTEDSNS